jgi:hypothetical protein
VLECVEAAVTDISRELHSYKRHVATSHSESDKLLQLLQAEQKVREESELTLYEWVALGCVSPPFHVLLCAQSSYVG